MAQHCAPGAMALHGQVAVTDARDAVDTGQVGELLGGMEQGFFEIEALTQGSNDGGSHASHRFVQQGDHGCGMAHVAQVRYHLDTPFVLAQRQLRT